MTQRPDVDEALQRAREALDAGHGLEGTGFWRAVGIVRKNPELAGRYGPRIADLDRRAFEAGVRLRVPAWIGLAVLAGGTVAGVVLLAVAGRFDGWLGIAVFLAGFGALIVSTHSLGHWVVGRALGMRFTHVFVGGPPPPRPGVKTDYDSYLRTPPRGRAVMHASGAVVTKVVPFALIPFAPEGWVVWFLVAVGAGSIVTDVLFSTKTSDWKKVSREWRAASARG